MARTSQSMPKTNSFIMKQKPSEKGKEDEEQAPAGKQMRPYCTAFSASFLRFSAILLKCQWTYGCRDEQTDSKTQEEKETSLGGQ